MEQKNEIFKVIKKCGLDEESSTKILTQFDEFRSIVSEWEVKANMIIVTNALQIHDMAQARKGRLFLKGKRSEIEKVRKTLKERSLREGQAIDGVARYLKDLIEPIEKHLSNQENFIEIQENIRKDKLSSERVAILEPLGVDPYLYNLKEMTTDFFNDLVMTTKENIRLRAEEEKRLEEERIKKEKIVKQERERIESENEKLKKEAKEKEAELRAEREKTKVAEEKVEKVEIEKKEIESTVDEKVLIARRAITLISQSTCGECSYCDSIRTITNETIKQIGGWLE